MISLKRAFLYDVRKKGKSLTLFLLLLLLTVSVMVGISIRRGILYDEWQYQSSGI